MDYMAYGITVLGERPNTSCSKCFHPGHVCNASKICPYAILDDAINKARRNKNSWRNQEEKLSANYARLIAAKKMVEEYGGHDITEHIDDVLDRFDQLRTTGINIHFRQYSTCASPNANR